MSVACFRLGQIVAFAWTLLVAALGCAAATSSNAKDVEGELLQELSEMKNDFWLRDVRRELHAVPELGFEEHKTSAIIQKHLAELGINYTFPVAVTGVVAVIGKGSPVFALRSDMDALPIHEEINSSFISTHPGLSHACGHDAHMAMLLGAAKVLKAREASLPGTVRLLFQPAEEGPGGAFDMVAAGALQGVSAVAGLHVWPGAPSGTISTKAGTIMAAQDSFECVITGQGGHGAMPHETVDPVIAAAMVVAALQPLVSRETDPADSAVVTVAQFNTGSGATNVISDKVTIGGTIRALTPSMFRWLGERVEAVTTATAGAHGCRVTFTWEDRPYPSVINEGSLAQLVGEVASRLGKFELLSSPTMGAEDFAFMTEAVPGIFSFLGIRNETAGSIYGLHTPRFTVDEGQLPVGAALHAAMALRWLDNATSTASIGHEEL